MNIVRVAYNPWCRTNYELPQFSIFIDIFIVTMMPGFPKRCNLKNFESESIFGSQMKKTLLIFMLLSSANISSLKSQHTAIDDYFSAIGGAENWKKVNSVSIKEEGALWFNSHWEDVASIRFFQEPNLYLSVTNYSFGKKAWLFDGKSGYELMFTRHISKMAEGEVESMHKRMLFSSYPNLILAAKAISFVEERMHGAGKYNVYLITSANGWSAEYYFNTKTYLLDFIKVTPTDNYICFYDYKEIDGLLWPTRIIGTEKVDNPVNERKLVDLQINHRLDSAIFTRKYLEIVKAN